MVAVRLVSLNLVHGHFKRWLAAIVGIELHAQPDCVATAGFHNKVSTVPESPDPKFPFQKILKFKFKFVTVFSVTAFGTIFSSKMSLENRFKFEIWF